MLKQVVGAFKLKNVETSASKTLSFAVEEPVIEDFDLFNDKY